MKIKIDHIDANPHRDLARNPLSEEQVSKLVDSIDRTGFWDNLVVRQNPADPTRYQLAYGHNRLEACRRLALAEVDLPVRDLSDYDMYCCMVDENNTQQAITPSILFENVTAALILAERMIRETENVEQFNGLLNSSTLSARKGLNLWDAKHYGQAKSAISDTGDGLGVFFIKHFMPSPPRDETLQNAIDSYYAKRRKAAAEARAAEARARQAEAEEEARIKAEEERAAREEAAAAHRERQAAERAEREARDRAEEATRRADEEARQKALAEQKRQQAEREKADKSARDAEARANQANKAAEKSTKQAQDQSGKAARAEKQSERMDHAGIDRALLERLESISKMNDVVRLIRQEKIPKEHHAALIEAAKGWSPDGPSTDRAGTSVRVRGTAWWDIRSGKLEERTQNEMNERLRNKFGTSAFHTVPFDILDKVKSAHSLAQKDLDRCREYFHTLTPQQAEKLVKSMTAIKENYIDWTDVIIGELLMISQPKEKDITPVVKPLKALEYNQENR